MAGLVQEDGSSCVTSSHFSRTSMSGKALGSPNPWLRELKSDERGLCLIQLLRNCVKHVASGNLELANACLEHISFHASPEGDPIQRVASYFTEALARRILKSWRGLYLALNSTKICSVSETILVQKHFFELFPFLKLAYLISNQAIMEAMEGEKMVHIIDLNASEPAQWIALLRTLRARPEGPPHLRITCIHEQKEILEHTAMVLSKEAENLDIPFQFNLVASKLENLNPENLWVKTGEALAISSVLRLHRLLASDDDSRPGRTPMSGTKNSRIREMSQQGSLGKLFEKERMSGFIPRPDSESSSPLSLAISTKMDGFLESLWGLSPKIMVLTEQESDHNGPLSQRFKEALNFYAALFDCLDSTVPKLSTERLMVERMLFGEEIMNIITCEVLERKERHEKLEKWMQRLDMAGFGRVPLSYYGLLQARRLLQNHGCNGYNIKKENGCFFLCWHDQKLFSVSAWRCRRYG